MFERVVSFFFKLLLFVFFGLIAPGQFGSTRSLLPPPTPPPPSLCLWAVVVPAFVFDVFVIPTLFQSVMRRLLCPLFGLMVFPIFPCVDNFKLPVSHCGGGNIRGLVSLFAFGTFDDESFTRIEFSVLLLLPAVGLFNGLSVASIRFCERSRFVITPPRTLNAGIWLLGGAWLPNDGLLCWFFGNGICSAGPNAFECRR